MIHILSHTSHSPWRRVALAALLLLAAMGPAATLSSTPVADKESEPFPGIRILERELSDPPQKVFAAFISLDEPTLLLDATEPTRTRQTVKDWAEKTGALVAVNGDFMKFTEGTPHLYGDAVGGGERWPVEQTGRYEGYTNQWFYNKYGWIAFGGDGNAVTFSNTEFVKKNAERVGATHGWKADEAAPQIPPRTRALVSGFSQLVVEGKPITCPDPTDRSCFPDRSDMMTRHPRTAMGLTEDMKTFILVVVDGRSEESVGMFGSELAALMHDLGSWVAINLDGGGSSQMYVKGRGIMNAPSDNPHRPVLNHWGVFEKK